ncbi:MAG: hypothetical protein GY706_07515, partial [Bacteroides sp.]|nr:hypothetical protein [Bacteroides sp.]
MLSLRAASSSSNARGRRRRSAAVSPAAALLLLRGVSVSGSNADNDDNAYRYRLFESRVITRSSTINDEIAIDWAAFAAEINAIAYDDGADAFWVNNWNTDIELVNRFGNTIDTIKFGSGAYAGLAYD